MKHLAVGVFKKNMLNFLAAAARDTTNTQWGKYRQAVGRAWESGTTATERRQSLTDELNVEGREIGGALDGLVRIASSMASAYRQTRSLHGLSRTLIDSEYKRLEHEIHKAFLRGAHATQGHDHATFRHLFDLGNMVIGLFMEEGLKPPTFHQPGRGA